MKAPAEFIKGAFAYYFCSRPNLLLRFYRPRIALNTELGFRMLYNDRKRIDRWGSISSKETYAN